MSAVRRAWLYGLTLVSLGILAAGIRQLLYLPFDILIRGSAAQVGTGITPRQFSLGLAMLIIGGPLWFLFWRTVRRNVAASPSEIGSGIRKLYLNLVLVVSAIIVLVSGADFLRWLLGGASRSAFSPGGLAMLLTMLAIWSYHWLVNESEGQPTADARTLRRWYVYILCGWGLVWLAVGLVQVVNLLARGLWGEALVPGGTWNEALQSRIAWIALGGLAWIFHWFRMSANDVDSTLRQVYFYLLTILGGAIAGLVALIYLIYKLLLGALGGAGATGGQYFQFLTWTIPTLVVSIAIWAYHLRVAQEEAAQAREQRLSARRVHFYLMSLLGLGTMVAGLVILIGILVDLPVNALSGSAVTVVVAGWWRPQVSAAIALLIVAVPLWLYYWGRVTDMAEAGGIVEWRARSRRVYLYLIIFAGIVALAADLVNIVYQLLNAALLRTPMAQLLRDVKWSLQSLLVALPVFLYHWKIARQDQKHGAEVAAVHKTVTVMVDDQSMPLVPRLREKLGFEVRVLRCLGEASPPAAASEEDLDALVNQVRNSPGTKIIVVACGGRLMALPYEEK